MKKQEPPGFRGDANTPSDPPGPARGRWDGEEYPPYERHPGFDRYPPPNAPRRRRPLPPLPPDHPGTAPPPTRPLTEVEHEPGRSSGGRFTRSMRKEEPPRRVDDRREKADSTESRVDDRRVPRKLTVTRVAALRGRELTEKGFATFQRAAKADGADKSGLTALTYATMTNFALDAAIAVALANTLFFASATAESKTKVALYLLITIAPFAVIAPLIGPALDRLQRGRRLALASSFAVRAVLAVVLIVDFDTWALYPLALCMMVLSKSFAVLKSAVTPRVLPPGIDLVRTNSRLTVFGLVGGTMGAGAIAALAAAAFGSTGALVLAVGIACAGTYLSLRIPRWVEITEGEVPATLSYHGDDPETEVIPSGKKSAVPAGKRRQPLGRAVVTGLWGNSSIRVLTGFLTFYVAFVAKATEHRPVQQAAMLGVVGAAAAIGNFAGNASGARIKLGRPSLIVVNCTAACAVVALFAIFADNLLGAALAALVAACASALAKVSLDAAIQDDLPPESIASGFGRSETVLQLSWVAGGAAGVLLPTDYWKGFAVVSVILVAGLVQTVVSYRGHSLLPGLGGNRPQHAEQVVPHHSTADTPVAARRRGRTADIERGDPIR
ncbi:MFS transporter [Nocardia cyriacigeorgica]|uniref:MFS transporter n=1 Tax=Nocardia cyriacigeorgica TaxID=135487 RepID=UPI001892F210|nr:MFS transporter [Nocardia cyriacigeorgica]MBF6083848.1 MFS transporter [Nocardia cyriacigeorgica]